MFGLGHQSTSAQAWINGGNPTKGFLSGSVGVFSSFYQSIAGRGRGELPVHARAARDRRLAITPHRDAIRRRGRLSHARSDVSASLPPQDNLFLDNHIMYALLLIGLALVGAGNTLGLGRRWTQTNLVQRHPWLT